MRDALDKFVGWAITTEVHDALEYVSGGSTPGTQRYWRLASPADRPDLRFEEDGGRRMPIFDAVNLTSFADRLREEVAIAF